MERYLHTGGGFLYWLVGNFLLAGSSPLRNHVLLPNKPPKTGLVGHRYVQSIGSNLPSDLEPNIREMAEENSSEKTVHVSSRISSDIDAMRFCFRPRVFSMFRNPRSSLRHSTVRTHRSDDVAVQEHSLQRSIQQTVPGWMRGFSCGFRNVNHRNDDDDK